MTSLIGSRRALRVLLLLTCVSACAQVEQDNQSTPNDQSTLTPGLAGGDSAADTTVTPVPGDTSSRQTSDQGNWTTGITNVRGAQEGAAVLRAVRVGRHDAFERITFEFEGTAMPGYHIEYVDRPVTACGSGHVVPLAGDAWLSIRFYPAAAHTEEGRPTIGQRTITINQPMIKEMKLTCDFEAVVTWVTGQSTPAHYKTQVLQSPLRLVLDVR